MPNSEHDLLTSIRDKIGSLPKFAHELADCAAPDFVWQNAITEEDLVLPLKLLRFPCQEMYGGDDRLYELYNLFDFLVSQYSYSFDRERPLIGLYVSSISLAGIVRHQCPDSAEFGIAGRCRVLVQATESIGGISSNAIASLLTKLHEHAAECPANYWDPPWIKVALLANALGLSSRPSVKADLAKALSEFLQMPEWKKSIEEQHLDPNGHQERHALEQLLQKCGFTSGEQWGLGHSGFRIE